MIEPNKQLIKQGRGIEVTTEALVALLRDRFPNLVDWSNLDRRFPAPDYSPQIHAFGLYWAWIGEDKEPEHWSGHPTRRLAEGTPIPIVRIDLRNLYLPDGQARCGMYHDVEQQCDLTAGHDA